MEEKWVNNLEPANGSASVGTCCTIDNQDSLFHTVPCQARDDLSDDTFGLFTNLYSTLNIYKYVQKIIEIHV